MPKVPDLGDAWDVGMLPRGKKRFFFEESLKKLRATRGRKRWLNLAYSDADRPAAQTPRPRIRAKEAGRQPL